MNFKTKWMLGGSLISVSVHMIAFYSFTSMLSLFFSSANRYPILDSEFAFVAVLLSTLFLAPAIAIALPLVLFLPISTNHKIKWFIRTSLTFSFSAPISVMLFGTAGGYLISFLPGVPPALFSSTIWKTIGFNLSLLLLFIATGILTGFFLAEIQRKILKVSEEEDSNIIANQWHAQVIKGGLISGIILSFNFIFGLFIFPHIEHIDFIYAPFFTLFLYFFPMFALTLPLTLLTATPAAQLHETLTAQNKEDTE